MRQQQRKNVISEKPNSHSISAWGTVLQMARLAPQALLATALSGRGAKFYGVIF